MLCRGRVRSKVKPWERGRGRIKIVIVIKVKQLGGKGR